MLKEVFTNSNDKITFGKYKGCTIAEILKKNYGYILWLHEEEICKFLLNAFEILETAYIEEMRNSPPESYYWEPD